MRSLLPLPKIIKSKEMLYPVDDEYCDIDTINDYVTSIYTYTSNRIHLHINKMTVDRKVHRNKFIISKTKLRKYVRKIKRTKDMI